MAGGEQIVVDVHAGRADVASDADFRSPQDAARVIHPVVRLLFGRGQRLPFRPMMDVDPALCGAMTRFTTDRVFQAKLANAVDFLAHGAVEIGMDVAFKAKQIEFRLRRPPIVEPVKVLLDLLGALAQEDRISAIMLVGQADGVFAALNARCVAAIVARGAGARIDAEQLEGGILRRRNSRHRPLRTRRGSKQPTGQEDEGN